eukprot:3168803-Rhodomonas_salina.2
MLGIVRGVCEMLQGRSDCVRRGVTETLGRGQTSGIASDVAERETTYERSSGRGSERWEEGVVRGAWRAKSGL